MLQNVIEVLPSIWALANTSAVIIGFALVLYGLYSFADQSRSNQKSGRAKFFLLSGIMLLNLPASMDVISQSLFLRDSYSSLSYDPGTSYSGAVYVKFSIYITMIVGIFGVIKGWVILNRASDNPSELWRALVLIAGGCIAVNIVTFIEFTANTIGGDFKEVIETFLPYQF